MSANSTVSKALYDKAIRERDDFERQLKGLGKAYTEVSDSAINNDSKIQVLYKQLDQLMLMNMELKRELDHAMRTAGVSM